MSEMAPQQKNVLVTGGAGFLGSHVCERLLRDGARVICLDNFSTSHVRNIQSFLQHPQFEFLRVDVNQPFNLETFAELARFKIPFQGIQEIYHLACPTSIKQFDQFKIQTLLCNSIGNYHVLELARKYRSRVLLSSSSVVYGAREEHKGLLKEETMGVVDHLSGRACYDEGRRFSETMFQTYHQVHGLDIRIARIFRTYGPKMPIFDGHLIPDFVLAAIEGKELHVYGGDQFRTSLLYVSDAVDGLVRLMRAESYDGPVNIGSDQDLLMTEVAQMIIDMVGSDSEVLHEENLPFLSELGLPDISRAKDLGWIPLVRLQEGLKKTIEYTKANKLLLKSL